MFKLAIFVENSVRNYELLEISIFSEKREDNNNLTKYSHRLS